MNTKIKFIFGNIDLGPDWIFTYDEKEDTIMKTSIHKTKSFSMYEDDVNFKIIDMASILIEKYSLPRKDFSDCMNKLFISIKCQETLQMVYVTRCINVIFDLVEDGLYQYDQFMSSLCTKTIVLLISMISRDINKKIKILDFQSVFDEKLNKFFININLADKIKKDDIKQLMENRLFMHLLLSNNVNPCTVLNLEGISYRYINGTDTSFFFEGYHEDNEDKKERKYIV